MKLACRKITTPLDSVDVDSNAFDKMSEDTEETKFNGDGGVVKENEGVVAFAHVSTGLIHKGRSC